MSNLQICGVFEIPDVVTKNKITKILSCLSNYTVVDKMYGFTQMVLDLNRVHWSDSKNWLRLNMEDTSVPTATDAPTMEEVIKGITFGASSLKSGDNLLVHCQLGISRSPAMAIGSFIANGDSFQQAYDKVKVIRPRMDPNELIIKLLDEHFGLKGELVQLNNGYRSEIRSTLKGNYKKIMESYMGDDVAMSAIFEHISSLDRLN
jgi:predicted protein tyrosine phosphatase